MDFSYIEQIILSAIIIISLCSFCWELIKRYGIISKGEGQFKYDRIGSRLIRVFNEFFLQKKVLSQRFIPGLMHAFVFWGFIAFSLITLDHFLRGFNSELFNANTRYYYSIIFGLPWSILVLVGILYLAYRRFYIKPKFLGEKISYTSALVTVFISTLMITYMLDSYWIINGSHHEIITFKINWFIHAILILCFLFLIPRSKHLHLVLSPINIFFKSFEMPNHRPIPIDMEAIPMTIGKEKPIAANSSVPIQPT